jgi:hypothetical protein
MKGRVLRQTEASPSAVWGVHRAKVSLTVAPAAVKLQFEPFVGNPGMNMTVLDLCTNRAHVGRPLADTKGLVCSSSTSVR